MKTIRQVLREASEYLTDRIERDILLGFVLNKTRTYLYTDPERTLSDQDVQRFLTLIQERVAGTPIAYLTGTREFWSLPLIVTPDTLIPRPETEMLIELTLSLIGTQEQASILDCGTGAGGVAIALAKEKPHWQIVACDNSQAALDVAQQNARQLGCQNIRFYLSDWFSMIPKALFFDAIVSNPPYIASDDPHIKQGDLRFEPYSALVSGKDGLDAIREIIEQSLARLKINGLLLVEHGYTQKNALTQLLSEFGYQSIQCWQDWQGHDRISGARIYIEE